MKKLILLLTLYLLVLTGCTSHSALPETKNFKAAPETMLPKNVRVWQWPHDLPDNQGLSENALNRLHNELDNVNVLAMVIVKNDYIIDEYYKPGYDETSLFILNSASKSITSALIGIAIEQGFIENVNVPAAEYFPELAGTNITIWHLLTHTSGMATTDSERWEDWRRSANWLDYIFRLPITAEPGVEFSYSTGNTHILAAILEKAAGMSLYEFGQKYLFEPAGMSSVQIDTDPQGIGDGGNGIWLNVYDMTRFGSLYLHNGVWQGRQIISENWVRESTSLQFDRSSGSADYGYQWWVRTFGEPRYPAYFAQGHGGQYIFVVPDLQLVVVFTSNYTGSSSIYWQFMNDIVAACY